MNNSATLLYSLLLIVGDFLALTVAFSIAYILRFKATADSPVAPIASMRYLYAVMAVLPLWLLAHASIGLYSSVVFRKRFSELGRLLIGSLLGTLVIIGYDFMSQDVFLPGRLVPLYGLVLGFGFLVLFRGILRGLRQALFRYNFGVSNVLIVGNNAKSVELANSIANTRTTGLRVVALVGARSDHFIHFPSFDAAAKADLGHIHSIIQTELYADTTNDLILQYAHENHISYRFVPGNSNLFVGNIAVELFAGLPMIAVHQTALIGWGRIVKRLFDLTITTSALLILWPVMLLICILEKLSDPRGAIFFRQKRLTRFNNEFSVFKFRTHKPHVNGRSDKEAFQILGIPELYEKYVREGYKLDHDPRVSRLGRFLRVTSLDELPQLFNVLRGDLSLVGPRALIPEELNTYLKKHAILSVKSGITGLAQVSGRESISFDERRKLDMYYVQNWSFWMDIVILLKTLKAVLSRSGAR